MSASRSSLLMGKWLSSSVVAYICHPYIQSILNNGSWSSSPTKKNATKRFGWFNWSQSWSKKDSPKRTARPGKLMVGRLRLPFAARANLPGRTVKLNLRVATISNINFPKLFTVQELIFWLVVSTHLKNISQNGNLPQVGVKRKNLWNHHLVLVDFSHNSSLPNCRFKKTHNFPLLNLQKKFPKNFPDFPKSTCQMSR